MTCGMFRDPRTTKWSRFGSRRCRWFRRRMDSMDWMKMFKKLHLNIEWWSEELGVWVMNQRKFRKAFKKRAEDHVGDDKKNAASITERRSRYG